MKKKFSIMNMKVKNKLTVFSTVLLFFMLTIAICGFRVVTLTNQAHTSRYNNYGQGQLELCEAFSNFHEVKVHLRNMLYLYADDDAKQQAEITTINEKIKEAEEHLDAFSKRLDKYDSKIADNYEKCMGYAEEYKESVNRAISYVNSGKLESAKNELLTTGVSSANNAEAVFETIMADMEDAAESASDLIETQISGMKIIIVVICIVSYIVAAISVLTLIKAITGPMAKLSVAAKKLAVGDVEVDCTKLHDDDLGEVMDEFSNMADAIKEQAKIAEIIANGDLTVRVEPRCEKDILGKALQKLVADDNATLGNIKESTMQVTIGAEQVATASQALAQGSTEQASALQQVTASMDEIAERTKENASQAGEANELVHNVKDMAVSGNEQMKDMIHAMNDINESSETISKIIKVIDDIAFQTNILALNAAVEAARAGVHGKGFAVVAEEVRNLAAKSASAASETAEMIEDSIHKVSNGTKLAEETAQSLDEIVGSIDKIVSLISNIAVASNDQATAVSQIDQAIGQVSTVVQTNSATSEQCAAASEELSNQAATLRNLMANYKLATASGQSSFFTEHEKNTSYNTSNYNEQIISLDGEFGKY